MTDSLEAALGAGDPPLEIARLGDIALSPLPRPVPRRLPDRRQAQSAKGRSGDSGPAEQRSLRAMAEPYTGGGHGRDITWILGAMSAPDRLVEPWPGSVWILAVRSRGIRDAKTVERTRSCCSTLVGFAWLRTPYPGEVAGTSGEWRWLIVSSESAPG